MSPGRLAAVMAAVLAARWLVTGHVTMTVAGAPVSVPALAVAALTLITVTAALAALVVYRVRADQAALADWQARQPSFPPGRRAAPARARPRPRP
jgi:hypothetical protein